MAFAAVFCGAGLAWGADGEAAATQPAEPPPVVEVLPPEPVEADGLAYEITALQLQYSAPSPGEIPTAVLMQTPVLLGVTDKGYVAPRPGLAAQSVTLADIPNLPQHTFYASAVRQLATSLVHAFSERGIITVYIAPSPEDLDAGGADLRPKTNKTLNLVIRVGSVTLIRTMASGERYPTESRINNPAYQRIVDNSPVQPAGPGGTGVINKDKLDEYVLRLNRHPNRRVDVAIAPAEGAGDTAAVELDYLITENRPWSVYAQVSNTGTSNTSQWRQRLGYINYQLTNNDDIFSVDYSTASFDEVHSVNLSYEAPVGHADDLRWRVFGGYSQYEASDVGFAGESFHGRNWQVGADLIWNFFQDRELFVDAIGGLRYQDVEVDNTLIGEEGSENFFLPHIGLQMERLTQTQSTRAAVDLAFNFHGVAGTNDADQRDRLGRLFTDPDFVIFSWDLSHSFYLEPLFNRQAWEDPTSPKSSTLAHEIALSFRGQYSFEHRLSPQFQDVSGGLFSVRGYPESVVAGDTVILGSAEYRFHVPRVFSIRPPGSLFGKEFRWAPDRVYGLPDWDLILRAFVDSAYVMQAERLVQFEDDDFLLGAGVGAELLVKRNLNVRVDWGFALHTLQEGRASAGSSQVHILATLLY